MHRIEFNGDAFLTARLPTGFDTAAFARALHDCADGAGDGPPQAIVWDARVHARVGEAVVRLGAGQLDDLLLTQIDASGACAVLESVLARLRQRGAVRGLEETGQALAVLARDPKARVAHLAGAIGEITPAPDHGGRRRLRAAAPPSLTSVIAMVGDGGRSAARFIEMIGDQQSSGRVEILLVAAGLEPGDHQALAAIAERSKHAGAPRIRMFSLPGEMRPALLANTAVSLASGDAVILADTRCAPESSQTIQILAGWAMGAEVLTVSPRILDGSANLLAAGLAVTGAPAEGTMLGPWSSPALSETVRRAAAPAPWFFALNRKSWLAAGGVDPRGDGLWTASLAERGDEGAGRHLVAGDAVAVWLGHQRPSGIRTSAKVARLSTEAARAARLVDPGAAVIRNLEPPARAQASAASFTDIFPNPAPIRLLVFADGYGASQAIAFAEGLRAARREGRAAVRVIEEAAFGPDGPRFDAGHAQALVGEQMSQVRPTAVVLSRFGHAGAYEVIAEAADASGAQLVVHLDDDLFDLPPCVGIERYRSARHPRRIHALHRGLEDADLILPTTRALAERLCDFAEPSRIFSLDPGAAAEPLPRQAAKQADAPLVIGYMGSASHGHDLEMVAPALNAVLGRFDHVSIDLFGSIADQPAADLLRGRVRRLKPVAGDYGAFKSRLAGLGWDIGLAPLRPIAYNHCKTPTKWAEYAEAGIATVVSDLGVYREMIEAGAAVPSRPDEWETAIARLVGSARQRQEVVAAADRLLLQRFSWAGLEARLLGALDRVRQPRLAAE